MAPLRTPAQHQPLIALDSSLAVRHGVQSTRPTAIAHELSKTYSDIRATALVYNGHLSKMQDQIRDLTAENTMIFAGKDAAIAELKHEVHELRIQNKGLSCSLKEETNNRKLAVVCAENLTRQYDIQGKEVVTLNDRVTELEGELAGEKAKNVADKGANEKLRSIN